MSTRHGRRASIWLSNQKELLSQQDCWEAASGVIDAVDQRLERMLRSTTIKVSHRVIEGLCVSWRFAVEDATKKFS